MKRYAKVFAVIFLFILCVSLIHPQESQSLKLLALKKAQLHREEKRGDFDRAIKLKEGGLSSAPATVTTSAT